MKESAGSCASSWSVAWICCFINFLLLGVSRLSGLLYLASISRYGVDRSRASLPFVLCYAVRNIAGPLIGYIGRKVEIRLLVACGCFISALGAGACFFAEDIATVTVLWGGVHGLGFGLGTILLPQILNQHFEKYISIANGIAFGGECVAGFVLPVIVELFLDSYGTSGTFLILSGLILHGVPAALLLKSPNPFSKESSGNKINDTEVRNQYDSVECSCNKDCCRESNYNFVSDVLTDHGKGSKCPIQNTKKSNDCNCLLTSDEPLHINAYHKNCETIPSGSYYQCIDDNLCSTSEPTESVEVLRTSKVSRFCDLGNGIEKRLEETVNHDNSFENLPNANKEIHCIVSQIDVKNSVRISPHSPNRLISTSIINSEGSFIRDLQQDASQHANNSSLSLEHEIRMGQSYVSKLCKIHAMRQSYDDIHSESNTRQSNDGIYIENTLIKQLDNDTQRESQSFERLNNAIYCDKQPTRQSNASINSINQSTRPSNSLNSQTPPTSHSDQEPEVAKRSSFHDIYCDKQPTRQSNASINLINQSTRPSNSLNSQTPPTSHSEQEPEVAKRSSFHAFRVFLDPPFILILLTQSSMIFIFTTVMTVIVDFSRDAGVSGHQEVYVLMCLSVSDMIGRFGLGWVTDLKYMSNIAFSAVCYSGTAILMVGLVFLRGFPLTMMVAFFIGLFLGGLLIVGPGIIMDYIEEDKVTMALASRFVLFAPMSLTQSSLIGFFREKLGSYSGLFYILGLNSFLCCVFSMLVPCAARWRSCQAKPNSKT